MNPVQTPVWFVSLDDLLYVVTRDKTGKIKRIRNNPQVRISSCNINGKISGEWITGTASFVGEKQTKTVIDMRKEKYGFLETIARFVSKSKGNLIVFSIKIE